MMGVGDSGFVPSAAVDMLCHVQMPPHSVDLPDTFRMTRL